MPSISILIPVYNGALFIQESLDSLYAQTFQDFEIVIMDDGSTDNTAEIIQSQKSDKIRYFNNGSNLGIIDTLNKGISLCFGRYIARMDADDIAYPERLDRQWHYMESNPDTVLLGSSIIRFSDKYSVNDLRGGNDNNIRAKLLFDTAINHPSAIIRANTLKEYGLKYSKKYLHAEDYGLWVELSRYGKIANLDDVLLKYRMHGNNISMKFNALQYQTMDFIRKMLFHEFWTKIGLSNPMWEQRYAGLSGKTTIEIGDVLEMSNLLNELIDANEKSNVYDQKYLKKHASWFWYVVFIHPKLKKFTPLVAYKILKNKKSIFYYLENVYKIKIVVKCFSFGRI
ncbi:MAG: hypothetical protein DI598_04435 [Pseudopedobacter saltans]|uniref:Glycosyltransferase 2-like domain-containing protein n=1 Tax=Pseudopedobacter saltans TaxID=151895 RepID=A0A2W5F480_9SPHI|nr:MAG: hypothetical protein DI598_04435 [Pseudopedobacter saltans]